MISVMVPCSCGEFIQGKYGSEEALISCPIDIYSIARVSEGTQNTKLLAKVNKAIESICIHCKIDKKVIDKLSIDVSTPLPYGKGYATSTSEMVAVMVAIAKYFEKTITACEIAKLCAKIEPTDSVMFSNISIFKHLSGDIILDLQADLDLDIVILELEETVNTINFRNEGAFNIVREDLKNTFVDFFNGIKNKNNDLIKKSMYKSAILNQSILEKKYFNEINDMAIDYNSIGINVAHSGSLIGVMFENREYAKKFERDFNLSKYANYYSKVRIAKVINGGWIIKNDSGGNNGFNN